MAGEYSSGEGKNDASCPWFAVSQTKKQYEALFREFQLNPTPSISAY
jgi:hypothetical protein